MERNKERGCECVHMNVGGAFGFGHFLGARGCGIFVPDMLSEYSNSTDACFQ